MSNLILLRQAGKPYARSHAARVQKDASEPHTLPDSCTQDALPATRVCFHHSCHLNHNRNIALRRAKAGKRKQVGPCLNLVRLILKSIRLILKSKALISKSIGLSLNTVGLCYERTHPRLHIGAHTRLAAKSCRRGCQ